MLDILDRWPVALSGGVLHTGIGQGVLVSVPYGLLFSIFQHTIFMLINCNKNVTIRLQRAL